MNMDINRINIVYDWLCNIVNNPNTMMFPVAPQDIQNVKNGLIKISHDIEKDFPFYSQELFTIKDLLFINYGTINPVVFGQAIEILKILHKTNDSENNEIWDLVHPRIIKVSKKLFEDGHYANAAEDAFIEINDRVKSIFKIVKPSEFKIPDGDAAITKVFSPNTPLIEVCDTSTDSGQNEQKGLMFMLQGAMSALRNPKAHANITITADDALRRLMFASMLMYKIDEAVKYSNIKEGVNNS